MSYVVGQDIQALAAGDVSTERADRLALHASNAVDSEVGRTLEESQYVETFEPDGATIWLVAPGWPAEVSDVVEDGDTLTGDDWTLTTDGALVREGDDWGDEVTVTYTTGFATDSTAWKTAERIATEVALHAVANPHLFDQESLSDYNVSYVVREGQTALTPLSLTSLQRDELARFKWRRKYA